MQSRDPIPRVPEIPFDTRLLAPAERLDAFATLTQALYECGPRGTADEFHVRAVGRRVGELVFTSVSFSPMWFRRSQRFLGSAGADFLVLEAQLTGEQDLQVSDIQMRLQPRHIHLRDWGCAFESHASSMELWSVLIPRNRLRFGSVLGSFNPVVTWSMERPEGRMLTLLWNELNNSMDTETSAEVENLSHGFLAFLDSLLGCQPVVDAPVSLAAMQQFLVLRLRTGVGVTDLCEHFHISRSTVYRMFEPLGGVAKFLKRARLERCHLELRRSNPAMTRVNSIAASWGFTDASGFARSFRACFGESPTSVLGQSYLPPTGPPPDPEHHPDWASHRWNTEYMAWFNQAIGWE